jgi:inosine-uridine nucleoside N-ribohydrolase
MTHRSPAIGLLGVTTTCGNAEVARPTNCLRILGSSAPAMFQSHKAASGR